MDKFPVTENLSRLWASIIVDELAKNSITQFYAAPGMRNAPVLAAAHYHELVDTYSYFDERALSYRALGRSKVSDSIPLLTCTSGTAMANFAPAIIEANKSGLPLIILTADRPSELVKTDSNQTIDQLSVIADHTCYNLSLEAPNEALSATRLRTLISTAIGRAKINKRPVHINLPLREPLDSTPMPISKEYLEKALESFNNNGAKVISSAYQTYQMEFKLGQKLVEAKNVLLVIGKLDGKKDLEHYQDALMKIKVPKYLDITSGLKYQFCLEDYLTPNFDHPEVLDVYEQSPPEIIIHIGGRLVSKHYYNFLERNKCELIHVTNVDFDHDPGFSNTHKIICDPLSFLNGLVKLELNQAPPVMWHDFVERKRAVIEEEELTQPFISKNIIENIDENYDLLVGNSTIVRSFDNFVSSNYRSNVNVFTNRGVSGIEGFVATLVGLSDENDKPKLLVLGDISFKHDLNSLYMLEEAAKAGKNLSVIIINNFQGDIFNLLPIAKEKEFLPLLTTPHNDRFDRLIKAFDGLSYECCETKDDFNKLVAKALSTKGVNIIEAITNNESNMALFKKLKTVKR
ncbi:2-succinyl-5-enolpyruvyl-6-hydroxy-3-cyclohexene-1-carboxylic-acid synthase [Halobacteriovorax sp. RT-2-6]|uniref:2-succinyl-5-enolpyruvyl-6-hydroxy-3- cyclohexene-1-carboxylic-acid synthase n=1 Tax=unclassified Halobacteriovorax TaxID=2639665 RepID=UPI0039995F0D